MIKTWQNKVKTNIPIIDEQHETIINLLNGLKASKLSKSEIYKLLSELQNFLASHFKIEENYMMESKYPELTSHKVSHEKVKLKWQEILGRNDTDCSSSEIALELIQYVQKWFFKHYENEDLKMSEYLIKKSFPYQ